MNAPTEGDRRKNPLTEVLEQVRLILLGHVLLRGRQHPVHQSAFKMQSAVLRESEHCRVGRPRQFWTTPNMEKAWNVIKDYDRTTPALQFNKHNRNMREQMIDHARRYLPPCNYKSSARHFALCEATQYEETQCDEPRL